MHLGELLDLLDRHFDTSGWWPAESGFEIMVGAILTQQTTWTKVEEALGRLKEEGLLTPEGLAGMDPYYLEEVLRPCGFYRQKARRVRSLADYLVDRYSSDPGALLGRELEEAREELLSIEGVGKETADSILLFAGSRAKFVAAAYVARVFSRTGVLRSSDYDEIQRFVESSLPKDGRAYARLYAQLVELAKTYCRKRPRCPICPLRADCDMGLSHEEEEGVTDEGGEQD